MWCVSFLSHWFSVATSIVNLHLQCRRNNRLRDRYEYISSGHITHTHPEITNDPQQLISQLGLANSYHSLKLQSSYATILGKEPELTNYTDHYQGCLDYIWVTKDFIQPIAVSLLPSVEEIEAVGGLRLPNPRYVSDHMALDCEFVLRTSVFGWEGLWMY